MSKRDWYISSHKDWNKVSFYDYSLKNRLKLAIESGFYTFDAVVTRHWLCGSGLPEFVWRIPVGKPKYDTKYPNEDGSPRLDNSLAALIWHSSQKLSAWADKDLEKDKIHEVFLTKEDVIALSSEWKDIFEDDEDGSLL